MCSGHSLTRVTTPTWTFPGLHFVRVQIDTSQSTGQVEFARCCRGLPVYCIPKIITIDLILMHEVKCLLRTLFFLYTCSCLTGKFTVLCFAVHFVCNKDESILSLLKFIYSLLITNKICIHTIYKK
jgi:hypothetical protein